nr:unnamed protein product [Digitaria exilis]
MFFPGRGRRGRGDQRPPPLSPPRPAAPRSPVAWMPHRASMALPLRVAYGGPPVLHRPATLPQAQLSSASEAEALRKLLGSKTALPPAPASASKEEALRKLLGSKTMLPPAPTSDSKARAAPHVDLAPSSSPSPTLSPAAAGVSHSHVYLASHCSPSPTSSPGPSHTALAPPGQAGAAPLQLAAVSKHGRPGLWAVNDQAMIHRNDFVADDYLCRYGVGIRPVPKSRKTKKNFLNDLIRLNGRKRLYTAGSIPFESDDFVLPLVDRQKEKERAEEEVKVTIRIPRRANLFHIEQFLSGRQRDIPQEIIQVLEDVVGGDHREEPECWRPYYQSPHPTKMGLLLNIETSASLFEEFLSISDASKPLSDRDHVMVHIHHVPKSRKTNRNILIDLIRLHGNTVLSGKLHACVGRKRLYTTGSLPFESMEFVLPLVDPQKEKERAEEEDKVTIRIAGRANLFHVQQFLFRRQRDMPQEIIQVHDDDVRGDPETPASLFEEFLSIGDALKPLSIRDHVMVTVKEGEVALSYLYEHLLPIIIQTVLLKFNGPLNWFIREEQTGGELAATI